MPIADGSEEIETACITDVLVRAGATVVTASVMPEGRTTVKMARGLNIVADCHISDCVTETGSRACVVTYASRQ